MNAQIAIVPSSRHRPKSARAAIEEGGGSVVSIDKANGLVFYPGDPVALDKVLDDHPGITWVQLPMAGIEHLAAHGVFDRPGVVFTCAKGLFGPEVGEHAFMLALTALRNVVKQARTKKWLQLSPRALEGQRVTIIGGGGIAESATRLFNAGNSVVTVLRRKSAAVAGAARTLSIDELYKVLPETDILILAMALTPQTEGMIGKKEIHAMPKGSVLINVARGKVVDTNALVKALKSGHLSAAGLDVIDPEPLPKRHKLWKLDNVLITSHFPVAAETSVLRLAPRITENTRRFALGQELQGVVDSSAGY